MKLIETKKDFYIIVDGLVKDEKDLGVWVYDDDYDEPLIYKTDEDFFKAGKSAWKITHSNNPLEKIVTENSFKTYAFISTQEIEELIFGYSLEKISNESFENMGYHSTVTPYEEKQFKLGYKLGFNAHKEFTKDRVLEKEFIDWIDKEEVLRSGGGWIKYFNGRGNYFNSTELYDFWKSLQPTEWEVEFINGKLTLKQ